MPIPKNVPKIERVVRIVLGVALIPFGFSLAGLWKLLSIVAGGFLLFTAFAGY